MILISCIKPISVPGPRQVTIAGRDLAAQESVKALQGKSAGWAYDDDAGVVWIRLPDQGTALIVEVVQ